MHLFNNLNKIPREEWIDVFFSGTQLSGKSLFYFATHLHRVYFELVYILLSIGIDIHHRYQHTSLYTAMKGLSIYIMTSMTGIHLHLNKNKFWCVFSYLKNLCWNKAPKFIYSRETYIPSGDIELLRFKIYSINCRCSGLHL